MAWSVGVGVTYHRDAFPAKAGVLSALLAQRGITGIKDCLQSKAGLYNLYFKGGYDPSFLTDNLGKKFEGIKVGIKAFPLCGAIPTYITATLDIVREHDIHPEDIVEVMVCFNDFTRNTCDLGERWSPRCRMDASLSLPFIVATAVAKRKVNIGSFTPEALRDPVTLAVAQKVMTKFDPELNAPMSGGVRPGVVAIKTKSGESYLRRVDFPYGHPKNPMTTDDLLEKFRDCVSYAAKPIPQKNIERAIELMLNLEKVDDVSQLIQLFT
jgi:2-methylcitrate dehydratase PrpD